MLVSSAPLPPHHHYGLPSPALSEASDLGDLKASVLAAQQAAGPSPPPSPPLTPPPSASTSCFNNIDEEQTPRQPPKPQPQEFPTVSAKLLHDYSLHPAFASDYTLLYELGSGGFGFVVRAVRLHDQLDVAVKFIFKDKVPAHGWVTTRQWGDDSHLSTKGIVKRQDGQLTRILPMEAYVLRNVRHPGVVSFVDLFEDDTYFYLVRGSLRASDDSLANTLGQVMEHHGSPWQLPDKAVAKQAAPQILPGFSSSPAPAMAKSKSAFPAQFAESAVSSPLSLSPPEPAPMLRRSSCDLFECIEQHSRFNDSTARYIFAQIVEIVYSLAQMGICHRDIKDENVVIDNNFRVKLIDFGSAVIFDPRGEAPFYNRALPSSRSHVVLEADQYTQASTERPRSHPPRSCEARHTRRHLQKSGRSASFFRSFSLASRPLPTLPLPATATSLDQRSASAATHTSSCCDASRSTSSRGSQSRRCASTPGCAAHSPTKPLAISLRCHVSPWLLFAPFAPVFCRTTHHPSFSSSIPCSFFISILCLSVTLERNTSSFNPLNTRLCS